MADREVMEAPDAKSRIGGTGPFVFNEWNQGAGKKLSRNKNYWQSGRPYLDEVHITVTRDPQALVAGLEGGSFDVIKGLPVRDLVRLRSDPKYVGMVHDVGGTVFALGLNSTKPPLDNKRARQALQWAVDRKWFNETALVGQGDTRCLPWNPGSPAYEDTKQDFYSLDLDKAKGLLNEAGISSGFELDMVITNDLQEYLDFSQIYQGDLAKIGVKLNIKRMDLAAWLDEVPNSPKYNGMHIIRSGFSNMEPSTKFTNDRGFDARQYNSSFKNERYLQLATQPSEEPDAAKRKVIYSQVNDLLLDEAFAMTVSFVPVTLATRAALKGVETALTDAFVFTNAWLDG